MKKMCPRCGVIYEVKGDNVYCSRECRELFQVSGLDMLKGKKTYIPETVRQHGGNGAEGRERAAQPFRPVSEKMANFVNDANTEVMLPKQRRK